jgi:tetratricopeptide (TPR) repeat protein
MYCLLFTLRKGIFKIIPFYIALFFFQFTASADETGKAEFDSIYFHIATVMSLQNVDSAIVSADSLLAKSKKDPMREMKCLMLLASLKEKEGEVLASLVHASKAEKIAEKENNKEWQMRIAGFLYSTYNDIGLHVQGKQYLEKVERLNKSEKIGLIQLYVYQAKAKLFLDDNLPEKSLIEINKADSLMEILSNQKVGPILIATSYQIKGLSYYQLDELDKAKEYFSKGEDLIPDNFSTLLGYIYVGLANVYLKENNLEQTLNYLKKSEPIFDGSKDFQLGILLNNAWKSYYLRTDNPVLVERYNNNLLKMKSERTTYLAELSNNLIQELKEDSVKKTKSSLMLIIIISSLVILIVMIVLYNIDRRKQQQKKYETIVTEVKDMFEGE